jgi:hypothetical protein
VADCCLIKLSPIHSCRLKVFTSRGLVLYSTPANQIIEAHRTGSMACSIIMAASIRSSQNQNYQINALPLRRTSWHYHSYHSLLGFACSLPRHRRPVLVGSCYHVTFSRGPCCSLQLPRTLRPFFSRGFTPTDYPFIRFILHVAPCRLYRLPWALADICVCSRALSSTGLDSHGLYLIVLLQQLYRSLFMWSLLFVATTTD